jgi:peroxiredoxin
MMLGFEDPRWLRMLAVGLCFTLLVACTGGGAPGGAQAASQARASGGAGGAGLAAPEFTLADLDGREVSLSDFAGQVVLLDFWATWCAPCREEIPMLNELHTTFGERGFTILAISDEDAGAIREFVADHAVIYPNLVGTTEVSESYGVLGLPTGYLVDAEGKIVESFMGPKPSKILTSKIEALLEAVPAT